MRKRTAVLLPLRCNQPRTINAKEVRAIARNRRFLTAINIKFSKTSRDVRDQFFAAVAECPFSVYAVVVQKELIYSPHLRTNHDSFYNYFCNCS